MKPSTSAMDKPRAKMGYFIINNKKIPVYEGINIIGRNREATVIIKDNDVSHQHAILVITERDHYLSDMKSINSTYVAGAKLIPFRLYSISDKTAVKFSTVNATYCFIQDDEVILSNTQSQKINDTIYLGKTQLYDSDVSVNAQSELVEHQEQAGSLHDIKPNYYIADDVDLAGVEVTTVSINDLPTQNVDMFDTGEIANLQQTADDASFKNDNIKVMSIHELPTQKLDVISFNNLQKSTKSCEEFCINDAPTQIINFSDSYEVENVKSNNESVSDSSNVIDETIMDDSTIKKNDTLSKPEFDDENSRESIDLITMQPASQFFMDSADTDSQSNIHSCQLRKKKSMAIKSDEECSEQNEEKCNKKMSENESSDETDVEDTNTEMKAYTNSEFEVQFSKLSKRKRNIITSDEEDSDRGNEKFGMKKDNSKPHTHVSGVSKKNHIMSDEEDSYESNRKIVIKKKRKSTDSSDGTDVEIETKQATSIVLAETEDNKQHSGESSSDETDIESERNSNEISKRKKAFEKKQPNKDSNESDSETDVEMGSDDTNIAKANGDKNDTNLISPTQNCFEGDIDFDFNTQDLISKANECGNSKNTNLQSENCGDDNVKQIDVLKIHDAVDSKMTDANENGPKNELNLTNKFNDSDVIQATPNCFGGEIHFETKANKSESSIKSTNANQNENSKYNSEDVLSESFHLALSCSIDANNETDLISKDIKDNSHNSIKLSTKKVKDAKDSDDAIFLQPTEKLKQFDGNVDSKAQEDTIENTINKDIDKNNDKMKVKTTTNETIVFLKPQRLIQDKNISALDDDDDIFLQPTQQLTSAAKTSNVQESGVFLCPIQKMIQKDNVLAHEDDEDIFLQPTQQLTSAAKTSNVQESDVVLCPTQKMIQKDDVLAHDDDDDIFLQPTQQLTSAVKTSNVQGSGVFLCPTQKMIKKDNVLAHDDDDDIFLQPTQQLSLPGRTTEGFDAKLPSKIPVSDVFLCRPEKITQMNNVSADDDDDIFLQPTQQLSAPGRTSEGIDAKLPSKVPESDVFLCPTQKMTQKDNDEDDILLLPTQCLPETTGEKDQEDNKKIKNDLKGPENVVVKHPDILDEDMFLQPTQKCSVSENSITNKVNYNVHPKIIETDKEIISDDATDDLFLQQTQLLAVSEDPQREEISMKAPKKRSLEQKRKVGAKLDELEPENKTHKTIFQRQKQVETDENVFLVETQKIDVEYVKANNKKNDTFLEPTRTLVPDNHVDSIEEKLADIFRPTQPDLEDSKVQALFLEDTQIIDDTTRKIQQKTDHVESQLEVMFASQNVKLYGVDDLRPPNPLVNILNDVHIESVDSHDVVVEPTVLNTTSNKSDVKINAKGKSKRRNLLLTEKDDEDADSIDNIEKTKKPTQVKAKTSRKTRSSKTSCDEITDNLMDSALQSSLANNRSSNVVKQYGGAKLRRSKRNSTEDNKIVTSIVNNTDEGLDTITESDVNLQGRMTTKTTQSKEVEVNKTSKHVKTSTKLPPMVDDSTTTPSTRSSIKQSTKDRNIAVIEDDMNIEAQNTNDKSLKVLPQNETTRTRAKRNVSKNKTLSEETEQFTHKSTVQLNHLLIDAVKNTGNTSKIETLPSSLIELNPVESVSKTAGRRTRKASTTSEDDFFVKASKRMKGRVTEIDNTAKSKKFQASVDTPERQKRIQKPKVVFTMLDSPELESVIRSLGGSVVDTVDACTVLLTGCIKRSQKLLTAVGQGKPICSSKWLHESKKLGKFIDPWDYILEDGEAEQKWNFSLRESLNRSTSKKLLENYTCLLLVTSAQDVLKGAIEACGGKCVTRAPPKSSRSTLVVVANPENKAKYSRFLKQNPQPIIVASEAIFDGVLRQELNFEDHLLT